MFQVGDTLAVQVELSIAVDPLLVFVVFAFRTIATPPSLFFVCPCECFSWKNATAVTGA
jgi:hypothetical protein